MKGDEKMKIGEYAGVKIIATPEQYEKHKKNLEEQIKEKDEELKELRYILKMQNEREHYSNFLKDFQKEKGKNTYPDFDEVYKRYDEYKSEVERLTLSYKDELEDLENLGDRLNKIKEYLKQIHIEQQHGILSSNNLIWTNIERLCDGLEILEKSDK